MRLAKLIKKSLLYLSFFLKKKPKIFSIEQTLILIKDKKLSIARYGDGEVLQMINKDGCGIFEPYNNDISQVLKRNFFANNERVLVAINPHLFYLRNLNIHAKIYFFNFITSQYACYKTFFDVNKKYFNACITRFYIDYNFVFFDKHYSRIIKLWKDIFYKRNLLIVEGYDTKFGIGTDLLDNSLSIKRIVCPNRKSFTIIDKIENAILMNATNDTLVLLSLGPSATIIASKLGGLIQCLDVGQVDNEYIWYNHRRRNKSVIYLNNQLKNCGESTSKNKPIIIEYNEFEYNAQIIKRLC